VSSPSGWGKSVKRVSLSRLFTWPVYSYAEKNSLLFFMYQSGVCKVEHELCFIDKTKLKQDEVWDNDEQSRFFFWNASLVLSEQAFNDDAIINVVTVDIQLMQRSCLWIIIYLVCFVIENTLSQASTCRWDYPHLWDSIATIYYIPFQRKYSKEDFTQNRNKVTKLSQGFHLGVCKQQWCV